MYEIQYTPAARDDLSSFRKFEQKYILDEIDVQLQQTPNVETHNRKKLRPNKLAEWELRVNKFRVFYDVQKVVKIVKIEAIGYKRGNKLFIQREEYQL